MRNYFYIVTLFCFFIGAGTLAGAIEPKTITAISLFGLCVLGVEFVQSTFAEVVHSTQRVKALKQKNKQLMSIVNQRA